MNEEESGELLRHVRQLVREAGRADLDHLLVGSRFVDRPTARLQVVSYLEGLRDEIKLGSQESTRQTMRRLSAVHTESGQLVQGIVLDITGDDQAAYGATSIDLVGSPALDAVAAQLDDLITLLYESQDR